MPRFHGSGSITRNPSGSYTLRYFAEGKQRERTFRDLPGKPGSGKRLAEDFSLKLAVGKREGDVSFADRSKGAQPFLTYCATWIERGQTRGESTKVLYRQTLKRIAAKLEGKTLAWVADHPREIEDIINGLKNEPKGASYVRRARVVIVGTCKTAVKLGDLPGHRLTGLDIGKDVRVTPAEFYPATHDELADIAGRMGRYGLLIWLGRYAGLRIGESLGLNSADIITGTDGGKVIVLQRQRIENGTLHSLKSRQSWEFRQIPIDDFLAGILAQAPTEEDGSYFPKAWRNPVQNRFNAARDAAGLPATFTSHDLRHLYASSLLSNGARLDMVSKILGHKSVEITASVYAHAMPSDFGAIRTLVAASRAA